jgi:hypothetical protein
MQKLKCKMSAFTDLGETGKMKDVLLFKIKLFNFNFDI